MLAIVALYVRNALRFTFHAAAMVLPSSSNVTGTAPADDVKAGALKRKLHRESKVSP
jgi:hypothetical protein